MSPLQEVTPAGGYQPGTSAKTLPEGSLKLAAPAQIVAYSINGGGITTSPVPTTKGTAFPVTIDNGAGGSVKVLTAATNTGMGVYQISFPEHSLTLTLNPATTYVDSVNYAGKATPYSTTLTWTIVAGP
jgi:hypothetical protein